MSSRDYGIMYEAESKDLNLFNRVADYFRSHGARGGQVEQYNPDEKSALKTTSAFRVGGLEIHLRSTPIKKLFFVNVGAKVTMLAVGINVRRKLAEAEEEFNFSYLHHVITLDEYIETSNDEPHYLEDELLEDEVEGPLS